MAEYTDLNKPLIGTRWRDGSTGKSYNVTNPYNQETIAEIVMADQGDVDEAYSGGSDPEIAGYRSEILRRDHRVPAVLRQAVESLTFMGMTAVVGAPPFGATVELDMNDILIQEKTIRGGSKETASHKCLSPN